MEKGRASRRGDQLVLKHAQIICPFFIFANPEENLQGQVNFPDNSSPSVVPTFMLANIPHTTKDGVKHFPQESEGPSKENVSASLISM